MAATATAASTVPASPASHVLAEKLNRKPGRLGMLAFGVVLIFGVIFIENLPA